MTKHKKKMRKRGLGKSMDARLRDLERKTLILQNRKARMELLQEARSLRKRQ